MNRTLAALALAASLAACSTPLNPTFLNDAQLFVAGAEAVDTAVAQMPGVPASATIVAGLILSGVQSGLTALQAGTQTPQSFAALVQSETPQLTALEADVKANQTITTGITLLVQLAPVIAAEVSAAQATTAVTASAVPATAVRGQLQAWVNAVKK